MAPRKNQVIKIHMVQEKRILYAQISWNSFSKTLQSELPPRTQILQRFYLSAEEFLSDLHTVEPA